MDPGGESEDRGGRWQLAAVLAVALFLRLPGLALPLWQDERYTLAMAVEGTNEIVSEEQTHHPPGYPLLAHVFARPGWPDWLIRIPALVGGLVSVAAVYWATRALAHQALAPFAALVFACSIYHVYYSTEARPYTWLTALPGISVVLASGYLAQPSPARLGLTCASCLLGCWMHYLALPSSVAILSCLFVWTLASGRMRARIAGVWGALLTTAGLSIVFLWPRIRTLVDDELLSAELGIRVGPALVSGVLGRWSGLGAGGGVAASLLALAGIVACARRRPAAAAVWVAAAAAPFAFFALLPWPHRFFESRYLLAGAIPAHVLACLGLGSVGRLLASLGERARIPLRSQRIAAICLLLWCALALPPTLGHVGHPRKYTPALRMATTESRRYLQLHSLLEPWIVFSRSGD